MILLNGKRIDSTVGDALPIGTLSPFVGLVAPKGYLICMGQLVDKAKYPELWELCGDTFGQSTTTQFYLPDLRGVTIAGYKQGDSTFGTLGALIGGKTTPYTPAGTNTGGSVGNHTLTTNEMPSHGHTSMHWGQVGGNKFGTNGAGKGNGWWNITYTEVSHTAGQGSDDNWYTGYAGGGQGHSHGFTQPTFTGTQANISTVQPTAVMNWIIKASMIAVIESNIEDSLTSTSSTDALSAKQGKVLKDLVDTKVNTSDIINNLTSTATNKPLSAAQGKTLNDKFSSYYTKTEIDNKSTVLYNNTTGDAGTITLSDSAANYTYIEIFYRDYDSVYNYTKVYSPNGKTVSLISAYSNWSTLVASKVSWKYINGSTISTTGSAEWNSSPNTIYGEEYTKMYIVRVVGYK